MADCQKFFSHFLHFCYVLVLSSVENLFTDYLFIASRSESHVVEYTLLAERSGNDCGRKYFLYAAGCPMARAIRFLCVE